MKTFSLYNHRQTYVTTGGAIPEDSHKSCYTFHAGECYSSLSTPPTALGRKQKNWLEWVLNNKTESLVIIFTHFEFFSPGSTTIQQYTDIEEVAYLVNLFGKTGVDCLCGTFSPISHNEIGGVHCECARFHGDRKYLRVKVISLADRLIMNKTVSEKDLYSG